MHKLFGTQKIENYFNQIETSLKKQINGIPEDQLISINIEDEVDKLLKRNKIEVPVLDTSKTESYIKAEQVPGTQLPSGMLFQMGKLYDIEMANYSIPFKGTSELFNCSPTVMIGIVNDVILNVNGFLSFKLTSWGKITGNNEAIEAIKKQLLSMVERINENLKNIENDVNNFNSRIKPIMVSLLTERVKYTKLKNDSSNKLNPFQ